VASRLLRFSETLLGKRGSPAAKSLAHAYRLARNNGGKPGVDGEDFSDIDAYGLERWLGELAQALKEKRYRASPVESGPPV
jgi:hypothetical protein